MAKGICMLSNIPLRKEPKSSSEMVSMLLFGEIYEIQNQEGDWFLIQCENDQYQGWINAKQYIPLDQPIQGLTTVTQYPFAIIESNTGMIMAPCGSQIPNIDSNHFLINNLQYTLIGNQKKLAPTDIGFIARQYLNVPYLWGGKLPFGIDCSGLTQVVYKNIGIQLKRDAYQQAEMGQTVSFLEETQLGDLAFFDNDEGKITHVGLLLDAQTIIHASGKVRIDPIDSHGILNMEEKMYSHKLRIIKRIIPTE